MSFPLVLLLPLSLPCSVPRLGAFSASNAVIGGAVLRPTLETCILGDAVDGDSTKTLPAVESTGLDLAAEMGRAVRMGRPQWNLKNLYLKSDSELKTTYGNQVSGLGAKTAKAQTPNIPVCRHSQILKRMGAKFYAGLEYYESESSFLKAWEWKWEVEIGHLKKLDSREFSIITPPNFIRRLSLAPLSSGCVDFRLRRLGVDRYFVIHFFSF